MIGLEFVTDKVSKKHNTPAAGNVLERLKDHRILAGKGGLMGNILRFGPPYCINEKDVDYFLQALDDTLDECTKGKLTYF